MATPKTVPTDASVSDFLAAVPDERRRADARTDGVRTDGRADRRACGLTARAGRPITTRCPDGPRSARRRRKPLPAR
jgi:hypothetical protein